MKPVFAVNRRWVAKMLVALGCWMSMGITQADTLRLGLIGDTPYSERERVEFPKMLAEMGGHALDLIAHIGDFKHGAARCDDAVFEDRAQLFDGSAVPFLFVPGDNDWTDCSRLNNGGYDPLERLNALRQRFWANGTTLGQRRLPLRQQAGEYIEHAQLRLGPALLVSLNLPGANNWGMTATPNPEYLARNPHVLHWLADAFAHARQEKAPVLIILAQANPGFRHAAQGFAHRGFRDFLTLLQRETEQFDGQVVFVHGDTHLHRIDQPLRNAQGQVLKNFTRVETFGYPMMGWVKLVVDSAARPAIRFESHPWPPKSP